MTPRPAFKWCPATPSRWPHVELLFGERGACAGCWCMFWRRPPAQWEAGKGAGNKRAFKRLITGGARPGVVGYLGGEPVAWCAVAPRARYSALERSRVLRPVDDQPVWSVSCLFVDRPHRRQGISVRMLKAAVEFAKKQGARIVEGYPYAPSSVQAADAFLWNGTPSAFTRAGFKEVVRRSKTRPIMRYVIKQ